LYKNQEIISPTKNTPEVSLDPNGTIKFSGRLIPENAEAFFNPIEEWIIEYFRNPAEITYVEISLEYMNSAGTKYLLYLIQKISRIQLLNNNRFIINWYCKDEDEDMIDKGRSFSSNLNVPFNFIRID
jgi:hypothetical protein